MVNERKARWEERWMEGWMDQDELNGQDEQMDRMNRMGRRNDEWKESQMGREMDGRMDG